MIIYWIIFTVVFVSAIANWKKTVLLWASLQFLLNDGICLKYESPSVSLILAINSMLLVTYLIKNQHKSELTSSAFYFKKIFILYLISYLCSLIFSILPFSEALNSSIKYFINNFGALFILQKALKTKADIKLALKGCLIVTLLIIALGLYETIFKTNPIQDYIYYNTTPDLLFGKSYYIPAAERFTGELQSRFGLVRTYSFFSIHIQFGIMCVFLIYLYSHLLKHKLFFYKPQLYIYSIILLVIGVLLSNSKTPMIGLIIILFSFISIKHTLNIKFIIIGIILISFIITYMPGYINNFLALFNEQIAEEGGGSNLDMRTLQFEIGINFFLENPLFGNGISSISKALREINPDILGAESSWIKISGERGLLGLATYIYLFIYLYNLLSKNIDKKEALGFILSIVAMDTATGEGNLYNYCFLIIVILRIQYIQNNQSKKQINVSYAA